jgi:hypothetical protein
MGYNFTLRAPQSGTIKSAILRAIRREVRVEVNNLWNYKKLERCSIVWRRYQRSFSDDYYETRTNY